jgi:hypothetical protein
MSLLRSLLFFFGAAVAAALAVLCLWVDIRVFGNDIPEVSLTEVVQESVLAVIVLVHLLLARKYAHLRYSNILIGGFFLAMLIRELDGLFDLLSHGSWVWFALLATAGSLLLPLRHLHQTLSQLAEKLGPARIVLQNGTRKSPITGRESPYTQALALWDELGLQGWLDEDEQTIKTLGVRVAAQGEYAVRQTFDGTVWIGSKDYREASWKDFAGFAHTLKLGGFTVYTRLPGPVSEEQSAQKAKLEALSAMVQISWKEPEQKAAKAQKYKLSKPTEPVLTFTSFNFKLAVMEVLMYEKGLLAPKLDAHEFAREYSRRKIDIDAEGYEPIPEIRKWLEKYPVPERLAPEVTEIEMDGGSEIYTQLCPFWDGEDGAFDLNTITEAELRQFPNLKHITLMSSKPEQVLPVLERCGIKVDLL